MAVAAPDTSLGRYLSTAMPLSSARTLFPGWVWPLAVLWTLLVAASLSWNIAHGRRTVLDLARVAARSDFEKDMAYRRWATMHGGVYVPPTDRTPSNPYLAGLAERDITTTSGRRLTLMNPAYMTRQVHELAGERYRHRGHITSLKPIRPDNAPDEWERRALEAFERGADEVSSLESLEGELHLRLMRPLKTEAACLKCHATQGYQEGDIRGGISVAVPMREYEAIVQPQERVEWLAHAGSWAVGSVLLGGAGWQARRRRRETAEGQAALRESETRHRELFENATVGVYRTNPDGRIQDANAMLLKMLGYSSLDELRQRNVEHGGCEDPQARTRFRERLEHTGAVSGWASTWIRKDGTPLSVSESARVVRDPAGNVVCYEGFAEDVSAHRRLEEQLRQAQKIEAVGRLAGGVAHDFNNILQANLMQLDLLVDNPTLDADGREVVGELKAGVRRAADLTRQLLLFGRRSAMKVQILDLNDVVADLQGMLRPLLGENVHFAVTSEAGLPPIRADRGMIEQVVVNLCVNARDAMPEGGHLSVRTAVVELDMTAVEGRPRAEPGRFIRLSVADTGCGMDAATLNRIFEPFFTTKDIGKGTGLGLATVHSIAQQHHGWVEVESARGHGSTFRVYLPAVEPPAAAAPAPVPERKAPGGGETIMLVEDEPALRAVLATFLRKSGYHVVEAGNGAEALHLWQQLGATIAVLYTDVVMPGDMTGVQLADRLRAGRPDLRVIISSGYSAELVELGSAALRGATFVAKPVGPADLAAAVRACLDRQPES